MRGVRIEIFMVGACVAEVWSCQNPSGAPFYFVLFCVTETETLGNHEACNDAREACAEAQATKCL